MRIMCFERGGRLFATDEVHAIWREKKELSKMNDGVPINWIEYLSL